MALIPIVLFVATACAAFYYWLTQRGLATEERASPQDRKRVSLLTETVAYIGASLLLAGGGVAVAEAWGEFTKWGHVGIFTGTALFFLGIGLTVIWVREAAIQRMIGIVWAISAGCAGAAAGIAAHAVYDIPGSGTAIITGIVITLYSGALWLIRRHEMLMVAMFTGVTIAVSATVSDIVAGTDPWVIAALGLWALGIGWVIVGWRYPQPLWTTVPLAVMIALCGPSLAVWYHGWVFVIAIGTAAAAMAISAVARNTLLLAAGTLALFGYIAAAVVRYLHGSLGVPATLAICGILLLTLAVMMAQMRRTARRGQMPASGGGGHVAARYEPVRGWPPHAEHTEHQPRTHPPARYQPAQHPAAQQGPAQHEPAQHEPAQHEPAQHQPAQHQPAQHQPAEHEPAYHPAPRQPAPAGDDLAGVGRADLGKPGEAGLSTMELPRAS